MGGAEGQSGGEVPQRFRGPTDKQEIRPEGVVRRRSVRVNADDATEQLDGGLVLAGLLQGYAQALESRYGVIFDADAVGERQEALIPIVVEQISQGIAPGIGIHETGKR